MSIDEIKAAIRDVPDFPKKGILFRDITPLLQDPVLFAETIDILADKYKDNLPNKIVGVESRGFLFGAAMAYKLGVGFATVRKKGKLPYKTYEASYELEYGTATVEIHHDGLEVGDKVVIVDDLLATGGTAMAAIELVKKFDAEVIGVDFVIELESLNGRKILENYKVNTILQYD